jgi:glutathione S-transferase
MALKLHHIPVCPFCQRIEILMELKGARDALTTEVVDITVPRSEQLLQLTGGSTALPVLELEDGRCLKESLVLMGYLEDRFAEPAVRRRDPYERAIENLMVAMEGAFVASGYRLVMNPDRSARDGLVTAYLEQHAQIDAFLRQHARGDGPWLFERFGWAEAVFAPFFWRFEFVRYYEGVDLPEHDERFARVRAWREACLTHPAAQQTSAEEVIKLYYDYARNVGNGALPPGRTRSSFVFEPHWRDRPMPPRDKYGPAASDAELGLLAPPPREAP